MVGDHDQRRRSRRKKRPPKPGEVFRESGNLGSGYVRAAIQADHDQKKSQQKQASTGESYDNGSLSPDIPPTGAPLPDISWKRRFVLSLRCSRRKYGNVVTGRQVNTNGAAVAVFFVVLL